LPAVYHNPQERPHTGRIETTMERSLIRKEVLPCDNLHQDIKGNCGQCHTEESWVPATFDHDEYFRFDREHTTKCRTCHINNDYSNYTCYGCHEHSRSNIREEHVEEGIHDYENCEECHRSGDEDDD
ncbi:MAG: hypothetical protein ABFS22_11385, partial [Pseudomonadota bacterium]